MIFNPIGRAVRRAVEWALPTVGRTVWDEPNQDRSGRDESDNLTPADVARILAQANTGDCRDQSRLALELGEKNWTILHNLETRRNQLLGCGYLIKPGDDSDAAKRAADALQTALDQTDFRGLREHLHRALLPGFAVAEIIWEPGGKLGGFNCIEQQNFTFLDSMEPLLVTSGDSRGKPLAPNKYIVQCYKPNRTDPARGGLIRPLAWMHVMHALPLKDFLSFVERYGMPFAVAKVDAATGEDERRKLIRVIRNFGPNGGGVISRSSELELVAAAGASGGQSVYLQLLHYLEDGATKLLLGQTASSGDSGGLSGGDAQSHVRQDILEADGRNLDDALNRQLVRVWTLYNYGPLVAAPAIHHETESPADDVADADTLLKLSQAGFQADPAQVEERFGWRVTVKETQPAAMGGFPGFGAVAPAPAEEAAPGVDLDQTLNLKQKYDAMGVAIRAGLLTATPEIEEQTRRELGLPPVSEAVRKAWDATGGIRQPITLKTAEAAAVNEALSVDENGAPLAGAAPPPAPPDPAAGAKQWVAPLAAEIEKALASDEEGADDEAFGKLLARLGGAEMLEKLNTVPIADAIESTVLGGIVDGAVAADRKLRVKGGGK